MHVWKRAVTGDMNVKKRTDRLIDVLTDRCTHRQLDCLMPPSPNTRHKNTTQRMTWTQLYYLNQEEFQDTACVVERTASWWRRQWRRWRGLNTERRRRWWERAASWKLHELRIYSDHRHTSHLHTVQLLNYAGVNYIPNWNLSKNKFATMTKYEAS